MAKFDMFNGKRDETRMTEKQLNKWYEVRNYIEHHEDELGVGDGLYINPDTTDITVTNIENVIDRRNFYPFTSLVKIDRVDETYYVDKDATQNIAFTYYTVS